MIQGCYIPFPWQCPDAAYVPHSGHFRHRDDPVLTMIHKWLSAVVWSSDHAYSKEETTTNLTKDIVKKKILPLYKKELKEYASYYKNKGNLEKVKNINMYGKGFINKTESLLKNPKTKTIRLEWE